jgi:pimeloyl-ACP methyl ester carboxylesterase
VWNNVISGLTGDYRVVTYARAGYRGSEPGPFPRDTGAVVGDLTVLLEKLDVDPPYVIAAHSLGATYALVYADEHPERVAGLVILDSPPLEFIAGTRFTNLAQMADLMTEGFRRDAAQARADGVTVVADFMEAIASEHQAMFRSGGQRVKAIDSLGDIPMIVVGSGVPNEGFGDSAAVFQEFWRGSSEALAKLSTRGRFVFVEGSTHNIPGDATDVVVDAIREVAR